MEDVFLPIDREDTIFHYALPIKKVSKAGKEGTEEIQTTYS
jgi:hypothetical protein